MPRLITAEQAQAYPTLVAAQADDRLDEVLADASTLLAWVERHPFASLDRARARAEADGITVDRFNAARAFLLEAGKMHELPDSDVVAEVAPTLPKDLEDFAGDELAVLARLFEVPGRSSMNRDELVAGIRATRSVQEPQSAAAPVPTG